MPILEQTCVLGEGLGWGRGPHSKQHRDQSTTRFWVVPGALTPSDTQAHSQIGSKPTFQRGVRNPPGVTQLEGKQPALQAEHLTLNLTMKAKCEWRGRWV